MAGENTVSASLKFSKGGLADALSVSSLSADMTGTRLIHQIQKIGTSSEQLTAASLSTGGWWMFVNRSTSGTIDILPVFGENPAIRLNPGEVALYRTATTASPYAIASAADRLLEFFKLEA